MLDAAGSQVHRSLSDVVPGCHVDDALGRLRPVCAFSIRCGRAIVEMGVGGPVLKEVVVFRGRRTQEQVTVVRAALGEVVVDPRPERWQEQDRNHRGGRRLDRHSSKRGPRF